MPDHPDYDDAQNKAALKAFEQMLEQVAAEEEKEDTEW